MLRTDRTDLHQIPSTRPLAIPPLAWRFPSQSRLNRRKLSKCSGSTFSLGNRVRLRKWALVPLFSLASLSSFRSPVLSSTLSVLFFLFFLFSVSYVSTAPFVPHLATRMRSKWTRTIIFGTSALSTTSPPSLTERTTIAAILRDWTLSIA